MEQLTYTLSEVFTVLAVIFVTYVPCMFIAYLQKVIREELGL